MENFKVLLSVYSQNEAPGTGPHSPPGAASVIQLQLGASSLTLCCFSIDSLWDIWGSHFSGQEIKVPKAVTQK